jgi:hypothetical protein
MPRTYACPETSKLGRRPPASMGPRNECEVSRRRGGTSLCPRSAAATRPDKSRATAGQADTGIMAAPTIQLRSLNRLSGNLRSIRCLSREKGTSFQGCTHPWISSYSLYTTNGRRSRTRTEAESEHSLALPPLWNRSAEVERSFALSHRGLKAGLEDFSGRVVGQLEVLETHHTVSRIGLQEPTRRDTHVDASHHRRQIVVRRQGRLVPLSHNR